MAYVTDYRITEYNSASTSTSGVWPDHVSGDFLLAVFAIYSTGTTEDFTTPTGMTAVGAGYASDNTALKAFWVRATSSSTTNPTSTHTSETSRTCTTYVIKDVPALSPIDTPYAVSFSPSPYLTGQSQSGSTTSNDVLIVHFCVGTVWRHLQQQPGPMSFFEKTAGSLSMASSWTFEKTAGAIDEFEWWLTRDDEFVNTMSIPIKSDTGLVGPRGDFANPPSTCVYASNDTGNGYLPFSSADPSGDVATITPATGNTDSITTYGSGLVSAFGAGLSSYHFDFGIVGNTIGQMATRRIDLDDGPYDGTGKKIAFHISSDAGLYAARSETLNNHGIVIGLVSGTTTKEYAIWDAAGSDTRPQKLTCIVIDNDSTKMEEVNTFDISDIRGVYVGVNCLNSNTRLHIDDVHILEEITVIDGSSALPANWETVKEIAESASLFTVEQLGDTFQTKQDIKIGNGSSGDDVYFSTGGQVLSTPPLGTYESFNMQFQAAKVVVTIDVTSSSTVKINDPCSFGHVTDLIIASGTATGATYDFNGAVISNVNFDCQVDIGQITGLTLVNFKTLSNDAADLSGGCTLNTTLDTNAIVINGATQVALQALLDQYANCGIQNSNTGIRVEYTGTGNISLDFNNITWTSCTTDIHYNSTNSSQLTAVMENGSNAATTAISGAATGVTISAPTSDLTLNSSESSTLLQIFTATTQTILDSATGSSLSYTHSGQTADSRAQKAGFLPQADLNNALSGNEEVNFNLVPDPVYDASHGLTYTTDASWSRAANQLTVPTFGPSVRSVHSLLIDSFIAEASLLNTDYNISMNGPNAMFLTEDAEGANDASIENMTAGGVRYVNASGAATAEWIGIESIGTIPSGAVGRYTADGATTTVNARAAGNFDQLVKVYGDATHGNFDSRSANNFILKYQINGYREVRVNLQDTYGITALEPTHYVVAMQPVAIGAATGDPGISITITDHGASPVTWNSKNFGITITDNATPSTGEQILRELNYNLSQSATYQGKAPIAWPEMVIEVVAGSSYETVRGYTEDAQPGTLKGVRVVQNDGVTPHPDFVRFQADDGTYFAPALAVTWSIPNVIDNSWVLLWNVTQDVEIEAVQVTGGGGYNKVLAEGSDYDSGDEITALVSYQQSGTAKEILRGNAVVTSSNVTINDSQVDWDFHNTAGVDGSTVLECVTDYVEVEVEVTDTDNTTQKSRIAAFIVDALASADGLRNWVSLNGTPVIDYVSAGEATIDAAVAALKVKNVKSASTLSVKDTFIFGWSDGVDRVEAVLGSSIIWIAPTGVVSSGSGPLTTDQSNKLDQAAGVATTIGTPAAATVSADIAAVQTAVDGQNNLSAAQVNAEVDTALADYDALTKAELDTAQAAIQDDISNLNDFNPSVDTVEGLETYDQAFRLMRAEAAGKVVVSGTTVTIRDNADSKDRITATVDENGQRTSVTTDGD